MANGNNLTVVGNTTRDPELRVTPSGVSVCNFGLAWNQSKRKGDDWENIPHFIDVTAFGSLAEHIAETVAKGMRLIVAGRFDFQSWDDKDTGAKRSKVVLLADNVGPDLTWATAEVTKVSGTHAADDRNAETVLEEVPF
jgi:single-strand DNA-binding protein